MDNRETAGSGILSIRKDDIWRYSTFILLAVIIVGIFIFLGKGDNAGPAGGIVKNVGTGPEIGDAPLLGDKDAPVSIVIFSDFSCPFCAAASGKNEEIVTSMKSRSSGWEPIMPNVIKDYVDTGKVKIAFKYFPGHGAGQQAMLTGLCLNEQGLFWEFHDKAFADYEFTNDLGKMKALAGELGADMDALDRCLASNKYNSKLNSDTQEGKDAGVRGTPAFFVNENLVSGAVPYSDIKKVIDSELGN